MKTQKEIDLDDTLDLLINVQRYVSRQPSTVESRWASRILMDAYLYLTGAHSIPVFGGAVALWWSECKLGREEFPFEIEIDGGAIRRKTLDHCRHIADAFRAVYETGKHNGRHGDRLIIRIRQRNCGNEEVPYAVNPLFEGGL